MVFLKAGVTIKSTRDDVARCSTYISFRPAALFAAGVVSIARRVRRRGNRESEDSDPYTPLKLNGITIITAELQNQSYLGTYEIYGSGGRAGFMVSS